MPSLPALGRQRQVNLCEFKVSLVYKGQPTLQRDPVLKNQNQKPEKKPNQNNKKTKNQKPKPKQANKQINEQTKTGKLNPRTQQKKIIHHDQVSFITGYRGCSMYKIYQCNPPENKLKDYHMILSSDAEKAFESPL